MRFKVFRVIIVILLGLVGCNLFYLQILRGGTYFNLSVNNSIRVVPLEGPRGQILDRNGVVLADNRHSFDLTVVPQEIDDKEALFDFLAKTLRVSKNLLLNKFAIKKTAAFAATVVAEDITKEQAIVIEENKYRYPGIYVEESYSRYYPFHEVGSHVLGYVGRINRAEVEKMKDYGYSAQSTIGKNGIEDSYDAYLRGQEGGLQLEVNSRGRQVRMLGVRQPLKGQDVQLTIDQRIQQMAYDELAGRRGAVVVMNLESGEILSLVSSPSFDPNVFVDSQLRAKVGGLFTDTQAPLLNRTIKGLYPPGSVFKLVVAAAGLSTDKLNPSTTFNCDGVYNLGKAKFRCLHVHGNQNLLQGITHSCNIYFYNSGVKIGAEVVAKYSAMLGLGTKTNIDLPFEEVGRVSGPVERRLKHNQGWYKGDTLNQAIGQGDTLTTPVQLLRMMSTLGRGGKDPDMYLLKSINNEEVPRPFNNRHVEMIPQVYDILQNALRSVVDETTGTAHVLDIPNLQVAGKTGTAQSGAGKNSHAWFVGYTLDGKSRVAICVFLEHGGSSYNAVLVVQQILTRMRAAEII